MNWEMFFITLCILGGITMFSMSVIMLSLSRLVLWVVLAVLAVLLFSVGVGLIK